MDVVTGATGLLGSHVVEKLVSQGRQVRAVVRESSNTAFLESLGVEIVRGSLLDPSFHSRFLKDCDTVYHTAAKVGEWGPWRQFLENIVHPVKYLVAAARESKVRRIVHVSSITVYGHPKEAQFPENEDAPVGQNLWRWDHYIRAKIQPEELARSHPGEVAILRPTWFFGPRDRTTLPRVLFAFSSKKIAQVGDGSNLINLLYVGDIADGVVRAGQSPQAAGRTYNLTNPGELTQKEFLALVAGELGFPTVKKKYSIWAAYMAGFFSELAGKCLLLNRPPNLTRYTVGLMLRSTRFSIERAKKEIGWQPTTTLSAALQTTLNWFFGQGKRPGPLAR